jgi:peptidoglycan/LPS O-acetylase OafA/YrhL
MRLRKVTVTDEGNVKFVVLAYLLGVAVTLSLAWLSWIFFEEPLTAGKGVYLLNCATGGTYSPFVPFTNFQGNCTLMVSRLRGRAVQTFPES